MTHHKKFVSVVFTTTIGFMPEKLLITRLDEMSKFFSDYQLPFHGEFFELSFHTHHLWAFSQVSPTPYV
jgi:hypothetical protein